MAPSRPDIPKKLAARVRGAQARATELRDSLIHNHKRRLQAQAELDVFHRDPLAAARVWRLVCNATEHNCNQVSGTSAKVFRSFSTIFFCLK